MLSRYLFLFLTLIHDPYMKYVIFINNSKRRNTEHYVTLQFSSTLLTIFFHWKTTNNLSVILYMHTVAGEMCVNKLLSECKLSFKLKQFFSINWMSCVKRERLTSSMQFKARVLLAFINSFKNMIYNTKNMGREMKLCFLDIKNLTLTVDCNH